MKIVGITGGISTGKSNVSNVIKENGYKVIDCDSLARDALKKDSLGYFEVIDEFKEEILEKDTREINRTLLAKTIFKDSTKREKLNNIVHPIVFSKIDDIIKSCNDNVVFIDMPLLYETGYEKKCDMVIVAYTTYDIQLKRLMDRDKIDSSYAQIKINSQLNLNYKANKADYLVDTSGTFEQTKTKILKILKEIEEK